LDKRRQMAKGVRILRQIRHEVRGTRTEEQPEILDPRTSILDPEP
jgi:hypothetical protein